MIKRKQWYLLEGEGESWLIIFKKSEKEKIPHSVLVGYPCYGFPLTTRYKKVLNTTITSGHYRDDNPLMVLTAITKDVARIIRSVHSEKG